MPASMPSRRRPGPAAAHRSAKAGARPGSPRSSTRSNASSTIKGTFYGLNVQLDFGGGPTLAVSSAFVVGSYVGHGNPGLTINYDQSGNVQPPATTTTYTTTQGVTNPGSTTVTPGQVTTVGTGSNLDE